MNETIHIVRVGDFRGDASVYGHDTKECLPKHACEDRDTHWYIHIEAGDVEAGHTYEFDEQGNVVREV